MKRVIPYDGRPARRALWRRLAPWVIALAIACAWDRAAWLMATRDGVPRLQWLEDSISWESLKNTLYHASRLEGRAIVKAALALAYNAVYYFGRLWPWIGLALVFIFRHWAGTDGLRVREGLRRGLVVVVVPALAGGFAEALKFVGRRLRPEESNGRYAFLPWSKASPLSGEFWNASHVGLASSHAAVAVGGALAAGMFLPRWRGVLWVLAVLCCVSRVAVGAHFASDVVAGAALAFGAFSLVRRLDARNNPIPAA